MIAPRVHSGYLVAAMSFAARSLLLLALTFSSMLAVDYRGAMPRYCGAGGGCSAVQQSASSHPLGVPLPLWGLAGLSLLLLVSLGRGRWSRGATRVGAALALTAGLVLIGLQLFVIHALCPLCTVVDVASVLAGALLLRPHPADAAARVRPAAWVTLAALAVAAPVVYPKVASPPTLPPEVQALQVPGKLTVVEFADFQCPFCRNLHPRLARAIARQPAGSVAVVRRNVPLPFHPFARGAALGYLCAEAQGRGQAMADHLFEARSLAPPKIREEAEALGLDLAAYDACIDSEATRERLQSEIDLFMATGNQGLPTTYIGDQLLAGARSDEEIARLFEAAAHPRAGVSGPVYLVLALGIGAAILALGWRRRT